MVDIENDELLERTEDDNEDESVVKRLGVKTRRYEIQTIIPGCKRQHGSPQ